MRPEINPEVKAQYYACMLSYVDDILCGHHDADSVLEHLRWSFLLKQGYHDPDMYLGAKMQKTRLQNAICLWLNPCKLVMESNVHNSGVQWMGSLLLFLH